MRRRVLARSLVGVLGLIAASLGFVADCSSQRLRWDATYPSSFRGRLEQVVFRARGPAGNPFVGNELWGAARVEDCRKLLDSLRITPRDWFGDVSVRDSLVLSDPARCGFDARPREPFQLNVRSALGRSLAAGLATLLFGGLIFAIAFYPHAGWQRFAIVGGCLLASAVCVSLLQDAGFSVELLAMSIGAGAAAASFILLAREIVLWVVRGFRTEKSS